MLGLFAAMLSIASGKPAPAIDGFAIAHVTLIDGTDRPLLKDATVVIQGSKIIEVAASRSPPPGLRVIEGRGKFLIPGLWNNDLHAFSYDEGKADVSDLLAHGVTTVRDMGGPLEDVVRLRADTASGVLLGPRLFIAGPLLEGPVDIHMPLIVDLFSEEAARREVAALKKNKVDYVEVDTTLTPALYSEIADAAEQYGLTLVGHIPADVSAESIVAAGQKDVEHLGGRFLNILIACSRNEADLRKVIAQTYQGLLVVTKQGRRADEPQFRANFDHQLLDSFDERKCQRLFDLYARNGVAQTPTLDALESLWAMNKNTDKLSDADLAYGQKVFQLDLHVVGEMRRVGVVILAGTDGGYAKGGEALDRELGLLVRAGFTPKQALQSATRDAATAMGVGADVGTIEVGKAADMVMLDADPLADVSNVRAVDTVFLHGRVLSEAQLQRREPSALTAPGSARN
jgi:cytosine/adenosine deaminase-related metal-dependent hydrolase